MKQIGECLVRGLFELREEWKAKREKFPELTDSMNHLDELIQRLWGKDAKTTK
jgi:hypothetical protein